MAEKKIVSASTLTKKNTKSKTGSKKLSNIDLNKVKDFVVENKDTIEKVVAVASELMSTNTYKKKKTTTKKTTGTKKKISSSRKKDNLSSMLDLAGTLLKK